MAQTFTRNLLHLIFSTKDRQDLIVPAIEEDLYSYLGGICRALGSPLLAGGGAENHVHLLVSLSKNMALAEFMMNLKKDSSKWVKTKGPPHEMFMWQDGYAAFSIGESGVSDLKGYIARQREHHRTITFQEELIAFLKKYGVKYNERYIWK